MKDMAKVLVVAYVLTTFLLLVLAFMLYKMNLSQGQVKIGIIIIYVVATIFSGYIIAKIRKNKRIMWGFMMGLVYFAVLLVVSLLMNKGFNSELANIFTIMLCCILGGTTGAIIS